MSETEDCSRCGATIADEPVRRRPTVFQFEMEIRDDEGTDDVDTEKSAPTYHSETRILCDACQRDMLEWIDEGDIDRSDCVDLPTTIESAEAIRRTANTLQKTADALETELDP